MKRFPPPFVLAVCCPTLQHAWALSPGAAIRNRRVKKKKIAHVLIAQARAGARAGPAREGPARSEEEEVMAHQRRARWEL